MTVLIVADHASNAIPAELKPFGVSDGDMQRHIAWDIGSARLASALAARLDAALICAEWSRLVIDLNRDPDHSGLIPETSDGTAIPHNIGISAAERRRRLDAYFHPYHDRIASHVAAQRPALIVAVHSFTPVMNGFVRPWQLGFLYNRDDRAARFALDWFSKDSALVVGDNQPYSGRDLNYTMDRHAEALGIPYLSLEIRQNMLMRDDDFDRWCERLVPLIQGCAEAL